MNRRLIIRPEAEEELTEARDWYQSQREGLGAEFLVEIDEVFNRIRENPELFAPEYKSVRRSGVDRFPYVVYYRVIGDAVEVIAVQHGARHPRRWRGRA